jgi:hypothetical protein
MWNRVPSQQPEGPAHKPKDRPFQFNEQTNTAFQMETVGSVIATRTVIRSRQRGAQQASQAPQTQQVWQQNGK